MKHFTYIALLTAAVSFGSSLEETLALSERNPSIQAAIQQVKVYERLHDAAKSSNFPSLDLSYGATYLKDNPVMYMQSSFPGLPPGTQMQIQAKDLYSGALVLTYPLFTGFAVTAQIDEAELRMHRASLEADDAKRNLYLGIVQAYATAVTMKQLVLSQEKALQATQKSYDKAKGFYELGMSASSELYRIEADLHAIKAQRIETENRYKIAMSQLSLMTQAKIDAVETLPETEKLSLESLTQQALQNRPDLIAMRLIVQEQQSRIDLAKSGYYPSVGLYAKAARIGDGAGLNGDGYTNKDKSAVGFQINYNLFSGFKTKSQLEAAREGKLTSMLMLNAYTDKVSTEIYESFLTYQSLLSQREAAKAQVRAQASYEALVQGQFENQLADADKLSRAISSSAMARALLIQTAARMYTAYARTLLQVDNETFLTTLHSYEEIHHD